MMSAAEIPESVLLESIVANYKAQGFEVYVHPSPQILPEFVLPYRLDAVAIKPDQKIAIELTGSSRTPSERITRLKEVFAGHPDWTLKVYYYGDLDIEKDIQAPSSQAIEKSIEEVEELRQSGRLRAALVMGWAILEGIARSLLPDQLGRAQPPRTLIETLASNGLLTPREADSLRGTVAVRNATAHGQLDAIIEPERLDALLGALKTLSAFLQRGGPSR
jgi:uncharacterized protein YutE (UPF0331/DUF86 family)